MSKSNASAKNRRAYGGNPPPNSMSTPQPQNQQEQSSQNSGFTLQQVIGVIDRRLINLETFMKESKENSNQKVHENVVYQQQENELQTIPESDNSINDILNEFNTRFDMIAEEITSLKDIVLKLQSYTMDVNKTLLEERIHILSDLGSTSNNENEHQLFDLIQQEQPTEEKLDLQALVKEEFNTSE
jgi:hypothetical protein